MPEAWEQLEGQVVDGKFHLGRYLGGSEHSAVFLTERGQGTPKTAAIKLIPADPGNADLQLFRWKLIAKLSHPHLARLFEMGRCQLDGVALLYVVMEYAEENLSQVLPSRALTPAEACQMLKPTLEALAHLHGHGFVHGHLKPANIMVVDDQLKLSSDGLCRIGERQTSPGKPGIYDPPEAAEGGVVPARDVWSFGVTLVQALTQLLPVWDGSDQRRALVLPETLRPPFLAIARNCLHRDPQRRWALTDIAASLSNISPAPAKPAVAQEPVADRPQKTAAQRRYVVPAVAAVLTLAALWGVGRLLDRQPAQPIPSAELERPGPQPQEPRPAPPETLPSARATLRETRDVRSTAPRSSPDPSATAATSHVVPGQVVQEVLPDVPQSARDTIRGTVRVSVRVRVDPAGNVYGEEFVSAGPSRYFARLASDAARRWKFAPAKRDGQGFPSAWILRFEFTRGEMRAIPVADVP